MKGDEIETKEKHGEAKEKGEKVRKIRRKMWRLGEEKTVK